MGLLDDAIREHLDLKRRRGADPSEIAREESEALGPVRREAPAGDAADAPVDEGSYADHEPAALDEPGVVYDDEPYEPEPAAESAPEPGGAVSLSRYEEDLEASDPYAYDDRPTPADPPSVHDAPYAEREEESATPPHGDPLLHQPTREFSATELDEALGQDDAPPPPSAAAAPPHGDIVAGDDDEADAADDELEETPDFLQETPEHDRLWFEQKPPKDFDF